MHARMVAWGRGGIRSPTSFHTHARPLHLLTPPQPTPTHSTPPLSSSKGTGCIFHYDDKFPEGSGKGFEEGDTPNFTGSYYSYTKAMVESLLKEYPNVLTLRVRMPIIADLTYPRNFITKVRRAARGGLWRRRGVGAAGGRGACFRLQLCCAGAAGAGKRDRSGSLSSSFQAEI
jgi:hypothetical protein